MRDYFIEIYELFLYDNFRGFLTFLFDNKNMLLMLHSKNYRLDCNDISGYWFPVAEKYYIF